MIKQFIFVQQQIKKEVYKITCRIQQPLKVDVNLITERPTMPTQDSRLELGLRVKRQHYARVSVGSPSYT